MPAGFFSDAVPHTKKDSFIAFYWGTMLTPTRHLICVLRKSDLCKCGCKGFCTLGAVQRVIVWSFGQMQKGLYPSADHLGVPFTEISDQHRFERRGLELTEGEYSCAFIEMRADLEEFSAACGFKRWSNLAHPCWCCTTAKHELYDFPPQVVGSLWSGRKRDADLYRALVHDSMLVLDIETKEQLDGIRGSLTFDDRLKDSYGGLCLMAAAFGLPKGARLLEMGPVKDLHQLNDLEAPCKLHFFDSQGNHGLNFICPLFELEGFSIDALTLDVMHVLDLGITQVLIGRVFWLLLLGNFCGSPLDRAELVLQQNFRKLKQCMAAYYKARPSDAGTQSEINNLSIAMLGPRKQPKLASKAAEARHLLPICEQLLVEHNRPEVWGETGHMLLEAARALIDVYAVMRESPRRMSPAQLDRLRTSMCRHLVFHKFSNGHCLPKHHFAWHLVERAEENGNPRYSWTYTDEQENRVMGRVAKSLAHGRTFYTTFLQKVLPEIAATRY